MLPCDCGYDSDFACCALGRHYMLLEPRRHRDYETAAIPFHHHHGDRAQIFRRDRSIGFVHVSDPCRERQSARGVGLHRDYEILPRTSDLHRLRVRRMEASARHTIETVARSSRGVQAEAQSNQDQDHQSSQEGACHDSRGPDHHPDRPSYYHGVHQALGMDHRTTDQVDHQTMAPAAHAEVHRTMDHEGH